MTPIPPAPKRNKGRRILGIIGLGFILLILVGIHTFQSGSKVIKEATPVAEKFLGLLEGHQYAMAYAMIAPQTRAKVPVSAMSDLQELTEKRLGPSRGHSGPIGWNVGWNNGVSSTRLTYTEHHTKGDAPVVVLIIQSGGKWWVAGYYNNF